MRKRYLFLAILSVLIFTVILVPRAAGLLPLSVPTPADLLPAQVAPVERAEAQVDARTPASTTARPIETQVTSSDDGPGILKRHCTQCHPAYSPDQIVKSPAEWERTLAQMEALGVRLNDTDRDILLDYLAASGQP